MRTRLEVAAIAGVVATFASCAPFHAAGSSSGGAPPRNPVRLASEPLCTYRVLGPLSGRFGGGPRSGTNTVTGQARALGADAVLDYLETPEFDAGGRKVATNWKALAIAFSDRSDPKCYR